MVHWRLAVHEMEPTPMNHSHATPLALAAALALVALSGCTSDPFKGITPQVRGEATAIFAQRCTPCHGTSGEGNGPASQGLTPKPRNFTDAKWQEQVTDGHIEQIVQYGGSAVGKSPAMPPNPDLMSKPEVVAALRAHLRSLKR